MVAALKASNAKRVVDIGCGEGKLLRELLKELVTLFSQQAVEKNLGLELAMAADLPRAVHGDPVRVRQLLTNLISNAVKFTEQGKIVVHVHCPVQDEHEAKVCFEVRDTGIGMTEEDLEYIFEPYTQLLTKKRRTGGLGLGLSIAKNLIEAHGGRIWVERQKGKGSSFFFSLPTGDTDE